MTDNPDGRSSPLNTPIKGKADAAEQNAPEKTQMDVVYFNGVDRCSTPNLLGNEGDHIESQNNELRVGEPDGAQDESSNDSTMLQIVIPAPGKRKRSSLDYDIDKEIEGDIQRELDNKAKKSNLTVKNVKSILRYVIGNESVLAMVRNAMKDSGEADDLGFEPKITRSKAKQLREKKQILWPLSPIKPPEPTNDEHLVLIQEELPEEEDDDDYRPNLDDLLDHSDDETGRQSIASSCDISLTSKLLESIDSNLLNNSASIEPEPSVPESSGQITHDTTETFKRPFENIGQRTRSKLSLSSTPLEAIEQAFIPPDITTDMYDFQCDNQEWGNFLKEFMQPLSNDCTDVDEEDDPEYNILAEEEEVDREELRQDRGVHISRAELRTLMMELLELPDEPSSDEEKEPKATTPKKTVVIEQATPEDEEEEVAPPEVEVEAAPVEPPVIGVTSSQKLVLQQQLRQHIQFIVQHFIQTHRHPIFKDTAANCKIWLAELLELGKASSTSVVKVFNLNSGFELVENWEKVMLTETGDQIAEHFKEDVRLAQLAKSKRIRHRTTFHPILMDFIAKSNVFMYPLLLPAQPFRCDDPKRLEFSDAEDQLIALGLEQFVPYSEEYPSWAHNRMGALKAASDLTHKYLVPIKTSEQIHRRVRWGRYVKGHPIQYYLQEGKAPQTLHFVIPFDYSAVRSPREQPPELLPETWRDVPIPIKTEPGCIYIE